VEAEQAAYHETAVEDDEICQRMHEGRRALYRQGVSEEGPYQSAMEDGMLHFHEFLRRQIEPHLGG
jgi:choline monooxygenase